jgi:hypothetical protein
MLVSCVSRMQKDSEGYAMTLAAGTVEYSLGAVPVTGCGFSWTAEELETALAGAVAKVVFDDAGTADLASFLESVPDTEFDASEVRRILEDHKAPEDWRVGAHLSSPFCHKANNFRGLSEFLLYYVATINFAYVEIFS